jgi:hypothetical protein
MFAQKGKQLQGIEPIEFHHLLDIEQAGGLLGKNIKVPRL